MAAWVSTQTGSWARLLLLASCASCVAHGSWACQSVFDGPSVMQATANSANRYASDLRPFWCCKILSVKGENHVVAPVATLFLHGGPTDIVWSVSEIVVYPVNGMETRRSPSNISQERLVGMQPLITDCDSATAVKIVVRVPGVAAPLAHAKPYPVLLGLVIVALSVQRPVYGHFPYDSLATTAAISAGTTFKVSEVAFSDRSAIALAESASFTGLSLETRSVVKNCPLAISKCLHDTSIVPQLGGA